MPPAARFGRLWGMRQSGERNTDTANVFIERKRARYPQAQEDSHSQRAETGAWRDVRACSLSRVNRRYRCLICARGDLWQPAAACERGLSGRHSKARMIPLSRCAASRAEHGKNSRGPWDRTTQAAPAEPNISVEEHLWPGTRVLLRPSPSWTSWEAGRSGCWGAHRRRRW